MQKRRTFLAQATAAGAVMAAPRVFAQAAYPDRPITVICGLAGSVEPILRLVQPKLGEHLGQPLIVDMRPGAGTVLAEGMVHKAPADGYTLLFTAGGSHVIVPLAQPQVKWDPIREFTPIATFSRSGWAMVVHADVPAKSLAEFVAYMKANPNKINYGSSGVGAGNHLQMARFLQTVGCQAVHVPYKTATAGQLDLVAGRVQCYFTSTSALQQHIDAGKIRALAYTSTKPGERPAALKFATIGLPEFDEIDSINVLLGPAGIPAAVVSKLSAAVEKALALPETAAAYDKLNQFPFYQSSKATGERLAFEYEKFQKVVKDANIKFES